jgi:hypothetical protein
MATTPPFDFRKSFQICRVFGIWKPMCEVTIGMDANGLQSVVERFFIWKAGSVEIRTVGSATEATVEAAMLSRGRGRERSPATRFYELQFAAGKGDFRPFIKITIEYDDQGNEKEHGYEFYVLGPRDEMHVATGYGDAIAKCQQLSEPHAGKSPDGTQTPPQEDKAGVEKTTKTIRQP